MLLSDTSPPSFYNGSYMATPLVPSKPWITVDSPPRSLTRDMVEERQLKAVQMRRDGFDYYYPAEQLGYASAVSAASAVKSYLDKYKKLYAEEIRALERERMDYITRKLWRRFADENLDDDDAISLYLKVAERRAKLCGLDMSRQEITHKGRPNNATVIMLGGDRQQYAQQLDELERQLKAEEQAALTPTTNDSEDDDTSVSED